jgi:hypothetical protein
MILGQKRDQQKDQKIRKVENYAESAAIPSPLLIFLIFL